MHVELIKIHKESAIEVILNFIRHCCPDIIKNKKLSERSQKLLIKKLIREKDIILQSYQIFLKFKCPIFIFNDLRYKTNSFNFGNLILESEDFSFELSDDFNNSQKSKIIHLYKEFQTIVDGMEKISKEELFYILPMSTVISFNAHLGFLELFKIIEKIQKSNVHSKTTEIISNLCQLLNNEFPDFFCDDNFEIFLNNKD